MNRSIQPLDPSSYADAACLWARAFDDDPVYRFMFPDASRRMDSMAWMFERWARLVAPYGTSWISPGGEAAALWVPHHRSPDISFWQQMRVGLLLSPFKIGLTSMRRVLQVEADNAVRHREELTERHYVLDLIGVDPAHHRKGFGGALVTPIIERADAEGKPCYLVTHNPKNPPYYERFGFEVIREAPVGGGGPVGWSMRRAPQR